MNSSHQDQINARTRSHYETRLFLLRHAEKDFNYPQSDAPLSPRGIQQAHLSCRFIEEQIKKLSSPVQIYSSQRQRCQATIAPLAKNLEIRTKLWPHLMENQEELNFAEISSLIERELKKSSLILVSHSDVLPLLTQTFINESVSFSLGQVLELEVELREPFPLFKKQSIFKP